MAEKESIRIEKDPAWKKYGLISDNKNWHTICDRWKERDPYPQMDEVTSSFEQCYNVIYIREAIVRILGKERFEEYRHIIPKIVKMIYLMGISSE